MIAVQLAKGHIADLILAGSRAIFRQEHWCSHAQLVCSSVGCGGSGDHDLGRRLCRVHQRRLLERNLGQRGTRVVSTSLQERVCRHGVQIMPLIVVGLSLAALGIVTGAVSVWYLCRRAAWRATRNEERNRRTGEIMQRETASPWAGSRTTTTGLVASLGFDGADQTGICSGNTFCLALSAPPRHSNCVATDR